MAGQQLTPVPGLASTTAAGLARRITPARWQAVEHGLAVVTSRMLRMLERDGLVTRTITASVPVRVDYQLTPLGRTLLPVVRAIKDWSETHISEVHAARVAYDHTALGT